MALAEQFLLADEIPAGITGLIVVMSTVGCATQIVAGQRTRLGNRKAVAVVVPAIGDPGFPIVAQLILETCGGHFTDTDTFRPAFIEALVVVDVRRMTVGEHSAAVEWAGVIIVFITQSQACAVSGPGQRWRDQGALIHTIVAPVILMTTFGNQAVSEAGIAQRPRGVYGQSAAALTVG